MKSFLSICLLGLLPTALGSACPNNCNGNGACGKSNTCECYRNWFGSDCSSRSCSYGHAFIDSPVGDLDGNLELLPSRAFDPRSNSEVVEINNVIGGVSELYSWTYGYARSNQTIAWNEAHFYRECSNKGICNRGTGLCGCFPGYEGEGCVRLSCPNKCSGHGMCRTIKDSGLSLAKTYSSWDLEKTQMCKCDPGYEGPDCSLRSCPRGADPVFYAHYVTNSVQGIVFKKHSAANVHDSVYYTVTATDDFGDAWTTRLMSIDYKANGEPDVGGTADLQRIVENVNASLSWNTGVSDAFVWGYSNGASYPSNATTTDTKGNTVFVDSQRFRLDAAIQAKYAPLCGSGKKGVCLFIQNMNHGVQPALVVDFFYNGLSSGTETAQVKGKTSGFSSSIFGSDSSSELGLVSVTNAQGDRTWLQKDGDVTKTFLTTAGTSLDVCANRGLCDYATGLCNCFPGYTGLSCTEQNSIAYTY